MFLVPFTTIISLASKCCTNFHKNDGCVGVSTRRYTREHANGEDEPANDTYY